ncbi:MAG TPA: DinB family protein [Chloroflexota bacterium]|nr:DinB family protein [Chloroflexota bacterium]
MPAERDQLLAQLDFRWQAVARPRLEGLTDDEYLWEPVPGCWNVRSLAGRHVVEGQWEGGFPRESPPPFTTIAWRVCHLGAGLAMRHNHHFGDRTLTADSLWERLGVPATAAAGIAFLERWQSAWRDAIAAQPDGFIDRPSDGPPGSIDGRFPFADVILHVTAEVIHHGAEIALLRDLYRARREIE